MYFGLDIFLEAVASVYVVGICGRQWHTQGRNWVNVGQQMRKMWNFAMFKFLYLPQMWTDSHNPKTKMIRAMRPTKYSNIVELWPSWKRYWPKKAKNGIFWGPVGQTRSSNMAASQKIDFLTLVSNSTLNTFGGLSRTVKAVIGVNLTISPC